MSEYQLPLVEWDNEHVIDWLDVVFQGHCKNHIKLSFQEHQVKGVDLTKISENDLKKDMHIKIISDRKRIYTAIQEIKGKH
jgi:hypothetical protein